MKSPSLSLTKDYFIGQTSVRSTMFRFDFVKPYHCLLDKPPCSTKALDATKDITKVPEIQPSVVYMYQVIYASFFLANSSLKSCIKSTRVYLHEIQGRDLIYSYLQ